MTELLPCPFCGGEARLSKDAFGNTILEWVYCTSCGAQCGNGYTEAEAIAAWNTRAVETCRNISPKLGNNEFTCEECCARVYGAKGQWFDANWNYHDFKYCPNCCARVVD